jgi:hypothetical protein
MSPYVVVISNVKLGPVIAEVIGNFLSNQVMMHYGYLFFDYTW